MSTILDDMREILLKLGFNEKEVRVYLALLEFSAQPASVIAKKVKMPKATVLFLFNRLVERGYITKSKKGRAQVFYADPTDLKRAKKKELDEQEEALKKAIPLLKEFKNPFSSPPKTTFFEGVEGCQKAYRLILESEGKEVREFATHDDLEKMGAEFMRDFIDERAKKKVFMKDVCKDSPTHRYYKKRDKKDQRDSYMYPKKMGELYSSIAVFDDKVLVMNLHRDAFAILIENHEVAETLKTIHKLVRKE